MGPHPLKRPSHNFLHKITDFKQFLTREHQRAEPTALGMSTARAQILVVRHPHGIEVWGFITEP